MEEKITKPIGIATNPERTILGVVVFAVILGIISGYILSNKGGGAPAASVLTQGAPKTAEQDTSTFRDFAEGVLKAKPQPSNEQYSEGTHILVREDAVPVALTSSVVDLSKYEGKKIKVHGETQKALKEGWLMDVGKVDEIK